MTAVERMRELEFRRAVDRMADVAFESGFVAACRYVVENGSPPDEGPGADVVVAQERSEWRARTGRRGRVSLP